MHKCFHSVCTTQYTYCTCSMSTQSRRT